MTGLDLLHNRDPGLAAGVRHLTEAVHGRYEYAAWAFGNRMGDAPPQVGEQPGKESER